MESFALAESGRQLLTVRELTRYVKDLLDEDPLLRSVWVQGEISNFKWHHSGHIYFTLKDEVAQVKVVMFRSYANRLRFRPENGMQVIVQGNVTVFERDGVYQLYAAAMEPYGLGALHLEFEQLKRRLAAEGLFDEALKRPIPSLPRAVGLVTAPTGAAIRDMITVARRRFPGMRLVLAPALVQGPDAPESLIRALGLVARVPEVDVVIIGRGGGSLEDLWAFNDERLARAIRACPVPVVSAVGHETDYTIADFAADLRAPTPSAAAELVVPSRSELLGVVDGLRIRLSTAARRSVERRRIRLRALTERPVLQRPQGRVLQDRQRLDGLVRRLEYLGGSLLAARRRELGGLAGRLEALSPLAVLARGYAIARTEEGRVVKDAAQLQVGDRLDVLLHRGSVRCQVEEIRGDAGEGTR
ncbi:exodeoxyribonuclease VII large subunit [Symbiobacterium thermophilum]|uniref:Exodeoxyribonuclease 7 large subunit n=1 Tax=Symbiobacterium thermophilum (strain DSM 24528 / JCM 14929 / IAM 14863 / T) TaxID=292459 RepID=Q67NB2_SYMTH|nr:exodeoxyribonuclease VII large subunit [Symbiobacterium thermophilum]BAD40831.1 exodeoxyribonuclease VII large subunit [Symbiobacterium thermophilum IAM 14863]